MELIIDRFNLVLTNAAGQEPRIELITRRALDMVAERLPMHGSGMDIDSLSLAPFSLQLGALSDDEAATQIADALLEALMLKLSI